MESFTYRVRKETNTKENMLRKLQKGVLAEKIGSKTSVSKET
jgi:hypothetical protein